MLRLFRFHNQKVFWVQPIFCILLFSCLFGCYGYYPPATSPLFGAGDINTVNGLCDSGTFKITQCSNGILQDDRKHWHNETCSRDATNPTPTSVLGWRN